MAALIACPRNEKEINESTQQMQTVAPRTDLDAFARKLTLPEKPASVLYEKVFLGEPGPFGPSDYLLVSVMKFEPDVLDRLVAKMVEKKGGPPRISGRSARPWFPPEVKAAFGPPEGPSGSMTVRGREFDAKPFLRSPLDQGIVLSVTGTTFLIVALQTM